MRRMTNAAAKRVSILAASAAAIAWAACTPRPGRRRSPIHRRAAPLLERAQPDRRAPARRQPLAHGSRRRPGRRPPRGRIRPDWSLGHTNHEHHPTIRPHLQPRRRRRSPRQPAGTRPVARGAPRGASAAWPEAAGAAETAGPRRAPGPGHAQQGARGQRRLVYAGRVAERLDSPVRAKG